MQTGVFLTCLTTPTTDNQVLFPRPQHPIPPLIQKFLNEEFILSASVTVAMRHEVLVPARPSASHYPANPYDLGHLFLLNELTGFLNTSSQQLNNSNSVLICLVCLFSTEKVNLWKLKDLTRLRDDHTRRTCLC